MTSSTSRTTCVALERDGARPLTLQHPLEGLLGAGVDADPEVGELVGGDERANLTVDQAVDRRRQGPDQLLEPWPVGDHPGEHVVEDRLDVDLLLDRVRDLGGDDVLDLGRADQRLDGVDVPLGVVERALPPVGDRCRRGQETRQHHADDRRDRACPGGTFHDRRWRRPGSLGLARRSRGARWAADRGAWRALHRAWSTPLDATVIDWLGLTPANPQRAGVESRSLREMQRARRTDRWSTESDSKSWHADAATRASHGCPDQ